MDFDACLRLIRQSQHIAITTHVNPDGDAIGSELALARALERSGKSASIINHDAVPPQYLFLDSEGVIRRLASQQEKELLTQAELIFILDANQPERVGSLQEWIERSDAPIVCIDHHLDPHPFADHPLIDQEASATGEIVFDLLLQLLHAPLPRAIAEPLYVAIMTDTGSFRFPHTDAALHRRVADLVEWGADPVQLYQQVYEKGTPGRVRLLGKALASLIVSPDGRVAAMVITRAMFQDTATAEADTENFINYTLTMKGIEIGLLFTELSDSVKVSFRSKGEIWINELARQFGGNGHKNAAGARLQHQPISEVVHTVLDAAARFPAR